MASKTVAKRAAELGMDQKTLVHALKLLSRRKLVPDLSKKRVRVGWYSYQPYKAILTLEQAAAVVGVDLEDADREIKKSYPPPWTRERVTTAIFAFLNQHNRWPEWDDFRTKNGLPSPGIYRGHADWNMRTRDSWERQLASDRRLKAEMVFLLRNVLARKEAIDRIGFQTFLNKKLAEVIDHHPEYGTLYVMPGEMQNEPMVILKVVNSTPEPDGSFSDYYLRVPPDQTNVREALKWTFNGNEALGSQPYEPLIET